jgi:hypothetical protein
MTSARSQIRNFLRDTTMKLTGFHSFLVSLVGAVFALLVSLSM